MSGRKLCFDGQATLRFFQFDAQRDLNSNEHYFQENKLYLKCVYLILFNYVLQSTDQIFRRPSRN